MEIQLNEVGNGLTVGCQHNLHERLVGDFWRGVYHDQDVVGIVIVSEQKQPIRQVIDTVVRDLSEIKNSLECSLRYGNAMFGYRQQGFPLTRWLIQNSAATRNKYIQRPLKSILKRKNSVTLPSWDGNLRVFHEHTSFIHENQSVP